MAARALLLVAFLGTSACSASLKAKADGPLASKAVPGSGAANGPPAGAPLAPAPRPPAAPGVALRFERYLSEYQDLTRQELEKKLGIAADKGGPLSFDPAKALYYDKVASALRLTEPEKAMLRQRGMVSVDHLQPYSMAGAYYAIYTKDLPVLITGDSILHALHRSYDQVLIELEYGLFLRVINRTLAAAHAELGQEAATTTDPALTASFEDVDLYLTVARNLLEGPGSSEPPKPKPQGGEAYIGKEKSHAAPKAEKAVNPNEDGWDGRLLVVRSKTKHDDKARALLRLIASLKLQTPDDPTPIYGGRRPIDYSQLRPRGHYSQSPLLKRYFRAMMWLGRADLGFFLDTPAAASGLRIDAPRERRDAALLSHVLSEAGKLGALKRMSTVVDFMVGRDDSVSPHSMAAALDHVGVRGASQLGSDDLISRALAEVARSAPTAQEIRSQVVASSVGGITKTPVPRVLQLFGQRFLLDSFVLSQVVFDSIVYKGEKQLRTMPSGLDAMAALGSDEAVRLLSGELDRFKYSANLLAARRTVEDRPAESWSEDLYVGWLDALRTLDDVPKSAPHFPEVMRGAAWQRKQLQTQLSSWAELRHDTLLYGKQSYGVYPMCEYPAGFVEPYPDLFEKLRLLASEAARRFAAADVSDEEPQAAATMAQTRDRQVAFFQQFASTMGSLETLAKKELSAEPFTPDEATFLKKTIDQRGGGSGPPRYDGWYPQLIYGGSPADYKPTVADAHTDPASGSALEVAVGPAQFLVLAIDNQSDRAVYVGPVYSYYEFTAPASARLTDEEWGEQLRSGKNPPRPEWTRLFAAPPMTRSLGR